MKKLFLILSLLLGINALSLHLHADEVVQGAFAVSPIKAVEQMKLGDKKVIKFTIINNYQTVRKVHVHLKSFKLINNNTEVQFDPEISDDILHIVREFNSDELSLQPLGKLDFEVTVMIDENIKPGGYSFALIFEGENIPASDVSGAATFIKQSIGIPVLLNVAGVEGILSGSVSIDNFGGNYINLSNSISLETTISNKTNEIIFPKGVITITKSLGFGPEIIRNDFNKAEGAIYSFTSRDFSNYINFSSFTLGVYKAKLDIVYATTNNISSKEVSFLIIPGWFIIVIILLILTFGYFKLRNRKAVKKDSDED